MSAAGIEIVELRTQQEMDNLRPQWDDLLARAATNNIFLSWEWTSSWWSAYGDSGGLRLLAAAGSDGRLQGLFPLRETSIKRYGRTAQAVTFLSDGSNDSDYLDLVVDPKFEEPAVQALAPVLDNWTSRGAVILLNEIPEDSPTLQALRVLGKRPGYLHTEKATPCGTIPLPASWDGYLAMLRPRFRTKVRSALRDLESRPDVRFRFIEKQDEADRLLPVLFDLHERRWRTENKPGVFGQPGKRDFYKVLTRKLLERGWLRFSLMEWKDRILACQYGFVYNGCYSQLQEGYEPECEHWNSGTGLRGWSVRQLIAEGVREYDFLGGWSRHKSDWGARLKHSYQVQFARATPRNQLFCRGPEWETALRERVAGALPNAVLEFRRSLRQRPIARPATRNGVATAAAAAARCYAIVRRPLRPLRDRFIAVPPGRRTEPTVRILYYHRVNDEADPFFPALSSSLFERQMRYLTRNHRVTSLAEGLEHLRDGRPEPVVCITFDDGYQDNYTNAFPVLRRLGLPATIFLATGSLDTREALWFEQLADALKHSPLDRVDLELDLPRRFSLDGDGRLRANEVIYGYLRQLPDRDRRSRLNDILRALRAPESTRRNMMLTWAQAREMAGQRIDFGGHTVTHPFLSKASPADAEWEIRTSKERIEQELQKEASYFAYPSGRDTDVEDWNKELVSKAGYKAAVTTLWGLNHPGSDPMGLRRGQPWEEDPVVFAAKLDWYQWVNG